MKKVLHVAPNHFYIEQLSKSLDILNYLDVNIRNFLIIPSINSVLTHQWERDYNGITVLPAESYLANLLLLIKNNTPDLIYLHGMFSSAHAELVRIIGKTIPLIWVIWGGDFYSRMLTDTGRAELTTIAQSLYAIGSMYQGDYKIFCKFISDKLPHYEFNYPVPTISHKPPANLESRPYLILGNSGDPGNNHIDLLRHIKNKQDHLDYRFILPMSYNGSKDYLDQVQNEITALGLHAEILHQFISPKDYAALILASAGLITAHNRQQAGGNISTLALNNLPVVLRKSITVWDEIVDNPMWSMLEHIGFKPINWVDFKYASNINSSLNTMQYSTVGSEVLRYRFSLGGCAERIAMNNLAILQ